MGRRLRLPLAAIYTGTALATSGPALWPARIVLVTVCLELLRRHLTRHPLDA